MHFQASSKLEFLVWSHYSLVIYCMLYYNIIRFRILVYLVLETPGRASSWYPVSRNIQILAILLEDVTSYYCRGRRATWYIKSRSRIFKKEYRLSSDIVAWSYLARFTSMPLYLCLLYTSDAADE